MEQQTAVDWLIEQIESGKIEIVYSNKIHSIKCIPEIKEQAKEIDKQQKKAAWDRGKYVGESFPQKQIEPEYEQDSEEYYTQTYKS